VARRERHVNEITDPDVKILAGIASTLQADYLADDEDCRGSPFAWIKTRPSRQVGTTGEAAIRNGRSAVLIDSNEEAVKVMAKRLGPAKPRFHGYER